MRRAPPSCLAGMRRYDPRRCQVAQNIPRIPRVDGPVVARHGRIESRTRMPIRFRATRQPRVAFHNLGPGGSARVEDTSSAARARWPRLRPANCSGRARCKPADPIPERERRRPTVASAHYALRRGHRAGDSCGQCQQQSSLPYIANVHFSKSAAGKACQRAPATRPESAGSRRALSSRKIPHRPGGAHGEFSRGVEGAREPVTGAATATRPAPARSTARARVPPSPGPSAPAEHPW